MKKIKNKKINFNKILDRIKKSSIQVKTNNELIEKDIYNEENFDSMLDTDELTIEEAWFMKGWEHAFDKLNKV